MSKKGKIRRIFPGGNTPNGFHSFYDYITPPDTNKIYILKGGPGVGKSTFMRKIAEELVDRGFDAELLHCSSDNNSLDGIRIPAIGVTMIDGTAPQSVVTAGERNQPATDRRPGQPAYLASTRGRVGSQSGNSRPAALASFVR